jgi:tetratricopeptide (TPR) repeat protein
MRRAEAVDRKNAIFTDHWIRRRIDIEQRDDRDSFDLEPVFPEAFAALPPGEAAYYRGRANFLRHSAVPPGVRPLLLGRAEQGFLDAIKAGFDNADSRFFLGKTYVYMRRWKEASAMMWAALEHEPGRHDAAFAAGQILAGQGQFAEALEIFSGMLARKADDPMALAEYGRCLWHSGRIVEALESYERAIELEPWNASLRLNRAMIWVGEEKFTEAAGAAERIVRLDPDRLDAWEFYERAMRLAGREELADEALPRIRLLGRKRRPDDS